MRKSLYIFVCIGQLLTVALNSLADIGLTNELKDQRSEMLQRISKLENDSVSHAYLLDSLEKVVISLDTEIMESFEQTIERLYAQNRNQGRNSKTAVYVALAATVLALFVLILFLVGTRKLIRDQGIGLTQIYRHLVSDLARSVSSEKSEPERIFKFNIVVVTGLVWMSISIFAFLIRVL